MELIWHYTYKSAFDSILNDGYIKVSEMEKKMGWRPAIWFSKEQIIEPTALKLAGNSSGITKRLSFSEQQKLFGCYRIGVNQNTEDFMTWGKYKYHGKLPERVHDAMTNAGIQCGGNPLNWFCVFRNVLKSEWKALEFFNGNNWENIK